jgi:hypothetical protein
MGRWLIWLVALSAAAVPLSVVEGRQNDLALPTVESASESDGDLKDLERQIRILRKKVEDLETEAEARRILRMSEEEESRSEAEILTAAGREYTLIPRKFLGFEYSLTYHYLSTDILLDLRSPDGGRLAVERRGNHTFTNALVTEYGLLDNLSLNLALPFVYKYDKRSIEGDREVTDLGDMSLGLQYQPFRPGHRWPAVIFGLNGSLPTGRSPYKINPHKDLATGSGYYSVGTGLTFSKTVDPVVAFGSIRYAYPFPTSDTQQIQPGGRILDRVEAGESYAFSLGLAFSISYRTSLNLSYQYAYHQPTEYRFTDGASFESNSWVTSSFGIGAGWRLSPRFSLYTRVNIGLTKDDPDFSFSMRIPVRFHVGG